MGRKDKYGRVKRNFLSARCLVSEGLFVAVLVFFCAAPVLAKSNLLLITIDTLRADRLGCYGYALARTPRLDQLAAEGIRLKKAFSSVPLTLPAHASILTGTYPTYHGIRDNSGFLLPPELTTLTEVLKEDGYQTGAFVGAFVLDSKFGLDQGFDTYFDDFDLSQFENVSPGYIQRTGDEVVEQAVQWLENDVREPFFVWVHLYDPHDPYEPPEPYASRHVGRPYDGEIEFTDQNVGDLLEWLRRNNLYNRTLVVVVGDHGESLGEHGEDKHGLFIYNAGLHVPLIFRLPDGKQGGREIEDNVSIVDICPTILQVLGVPRNPDLAIQGAGLMSLLLGKAAPRRIGLYAESFYPYQQFGWSPLRALIKDSYKYIFAPAPELYDLSKDFEEQQDVGPGKEAFLNRLQLELEDLEARFSRSSEGTESRMVPDSQTLERLRSLGYVAFSADSAKVADIRDLPDPKQQIGLYNQITGLFALGSLGQYSEAIPAYRKILSDHPTLKIVRYKLGQAYFQTGQYNSALEEFKEVIGLVGDESLATYDLALTYLKLGRLKDAVLGFERTLEIDPKHYRAKTNLGVLYKNQGRIPEAVTQLEGALEITPSSVFALSNLGIAYSMLNQHEKAIETLQKALILSPSNAMVCANLGAAYQRMGQDVKARQYLERARALNPELFKRPPRRNR